MTLVQITHYTSPNYTDHHKWIYTEYTVLRIFPLFRIFEQLPLVFRHRVFPQNFHYIEYISCHSRFLSNSALTLKNRVCTENFHCIQHTFYTQDFWSTCACSEFAVLNIYFLRWHAVRFVIGEALSLSKSNLRVYK